MYHASALIVKDSQKICFPPTGVIISQEMARDGDLKRRCHCIRNVDMLMLIMSTELTRRLHGEPYKDSMDRLDQGNSFIENLADAVRDMKDQSLLRLSPRKMAGRKIRPLSRWPALSKANGTRVTPVNDEEKDHLASIAELLGKMRPQLPEMIAISLEAQLEKWQENYNHKAENEVP